MLSCWMDERRRYTSSYQGQWGVTKCGYRHMDSEQGKSRTDIQTGGRKTAVHKSSFFVDVP